MPFSLGRDADTVIVSVGVALVAANRQELRQLILDEIDQGTRQFRIDFRGAGYIDSSGLGVLVSLAKRVREGGGDLRLANLNPDLRTLFALTKLDTLFRIEETGGDGPAGQAARRPNPRPPEIGEHERFPGA